MRLISLQREYYQISSLISGCANNDRNCQRELYLLLYDYSMKICYRYVTRLEEAEELANESFVKLFKNIHQFDIGRNGEPEALLKGWFKRMIINTNIDFLRKKHLKLVEQEIADDNPLYTDTGTTGMDKLMYLEIIEAIRQLTPVYRTVFNLFVIEGFSHEEIATQLKISVGTSKSNLSKARHNLRKIIITKTAYKAYV